MSEHTIGPMQRAEFCSGCRELLPNTWTADQSAYVHIGEKHYCPTCGQAALAELKRRRVEELFRQGGGEGTHIHTTER